MEKKMIIAVNILLNFIFFFFTEMLMVHLPTLLHLKGCIWDSVLHLIYLVSLLSFIFSLFYYHGMFICH